MPTGNDESAPAALLLASYNLFMYVIIYLFIYLAFGAKPVVFNQRPVKKALYTLLNTWIGIPGPVCSRSLTVCEAYLGPHKQVHGQQPTGFGSVWLNSMP